MRGLRRLLGRWLLIATMAGTVGGLFAADHHDDDLVDDLPPGQDPNGRQFIHENFSVSNIDAWVYGNRSSSGRNWLDSSLKTKAHEIARVSGLSEPQKQKLLLAGEGDIRRFNDRVEALKKKFSSSVVTQDDFQKIYQECRPLQTMIQKGLFDADSLFAKTLNKTLTAEQVAQNEQVNLARQAFRYRARTEMVVAQLGDVLGLSDDQRKRLVQLLAERTRPPRYGSRQDHYVVLAQMSRIPDEELKPIFDARQWRLLQRQLEVVPRLLPFLRQNGIIIDEGQPVPPKKPAKASEKPAARMLGK